MEGANGTAPRRVARYEINREADTDRKRRERKREPISMISLAAPVVAEYRNRKATQKDDRQRERELTNNGAGDSCCLLTGIWPGLKMERAEKRGVRDRSTRD